MLGETRATLEILICEIQEILDGEGDIKITKIEQLLDCWIKANDLHPERVRTYRSKEEFQAALGKTRSWEVL